MHPDYQPLLEGQPVEHHVQERDALRAEVAELSRRAEKTEAENAALRAQVAKLDLAVRVALAFTRPGVEGALHLLDVERVETADDLTHYLRVALSQVPQ